MSELPRGSESDVVKFMQVSKRDGIVPRGAKAFDLNLFVSPEHSVAYHDGCDSSPVTLRVIDGDIAQYVGVFCDQCGRIGCLAIEANTLPRDAERGDKLIVTYSNVYEASLRSFPGQKFSALSPEAEAMAVC